jgi:hypothetical protein
MWWPVIALYSGAPEIAFGLLFYPVEPSTPEHLLQHRLYRSFVHVRDGILLPTAHPVGPWQTSTFSVLEKHRSCEIALAHLLVL